MKYPQTDQEVTLVNLFTAILRDEAGMPEPDACRIAQNFLMRTSESHGGRYLYLGTTSASREIARQRVIAEFDGHNHAELASTHQVSRSTVYRWLAEAHKARCTSEQ